MHKQVAKLRPQLEETLQRSIAQHVWNLVPMSCRMEALRGEIVGVVVAFPRLPGPADERSTQAFSYLLLPLVQSLLRHFLPCKPQIARHGDQPQADAPALR